MAYIVMAYIVMVVDAAGDAGEAAQRVCSADLHIGQRLDMVMA